MIEKERLEKLIKNEAIIYDPDIMWGDVGEIKLNKKMVIKNDRLDGNLGDLGLKDASCSCSIPLTDLVETKEEAEWQLEFGNITRTETLNLPTWEEVQKQTNGKTHHWVDIGFSGNEMNYEQDIHYRYLMQIDRYPYEQMIVLWKLSIENENDEVAQNLIIKLPYTKENYIIACRKAKELFLGGKEN